MNEARGFLLLAPWDERERSADQIAQSLRGPLNQMPGVRGFVTVPGGFGGGGAPVQVVLQGTEYADLVQWRDLLMQRMGENPGLTNIQSNYEERKPQLRVAVDRNRAADLGVSLQTVSRTLETVLGSRIVTTFIDRDREYNVMLQGRAEDRATPTDLDNLYVRSDRTGELVPLSNLVKLTELAGPTRLNRFDRLRSITVSAALTPGYTLGDALRLRRERRREGDAAFGEARLRRPVARVQAVGLAAVLDVPADAGGRVPGAGGAVRELPASVRHHHHGAARGHRRAGGPVDVRHVDQRLQPDRGDHAGRPRRQERHPDRRVRQPAARPGRRVHARP